MRGLFPEEGEREQAEGEREQASEGVKLVPLVELLEDELVLKGTSREGSVGGWGTSLFPEASEREQAGSEREQAEAGSDSK